MQKAGWWTAAFLLLVLLGGASLLLGELNGLQTELGSVQRELEEYREITDRTLRDDGHFSVPASWETTPHVHVVRERGASDCFECHEPMSCSECHVDL